MSRSSKIEQVVEEVGGAQVVKGTLTMVSLGDGQCWGLSPNKDLPLLPHEPPPSPTRGSLTLPPALYSPNKGPPPLPFIPSAATTGAAETGHGQDGGLRTSNIQRGSHQPAETSRVGHSPSSQPSTSGQHPDGPAHRPIPMPLLLPALMGRRRAAEIVSRSKDVALLALNELLSPPILSTLVGIIVGCVTPLQVRRGIGKMGMVLRKLSAQPSLHLGAVLSPCAQLLFFCFLSLAWSLPSSDNALTNP